MARGRSNKRKYQILKILINPTKIKSMIIEDHNIKLFLITTKMDRIL